MGATFTETPGGMNLFASIEAFLRKDGETRGAEL